MKMRQLPWFPWVSLAARLVLGGVMLVAGALKVTWKTRSSMKSPSLSTLNWYITSGEK